MAARIPYHNTKIGQHDFHKPICFQYCKMSGKFCPFINNDPGCKDGARFKSLGLIRWTDIADARVNMVKQTGGYVGANDIKISEYTFTKSLDNKVNQSKLFDKNIGTSKFTVGNYEFKEDQQIGSQIGSAGFTCWSDGSGFEYDKMSQNMIGRRYVFQSSLYDITNYGVQHKTLQTGEWNSWVDKIQYDYRFGQVSDLNAQTILFPNVDNPWMFTEYVYKGIYNSAKKICNLKLPEALSGGTFLTHTGSHSLFYL